MLRVGARFVYLPIICFAISWLVFSGAEDTRNFCRGKHIGVIFNALCRDGTRRMFMYLPNFDHCIKLQIPGFPLNVVEKNWSVFVLGDVIYIVYSFNPVIVFRLDDDKTGLCSMVSPHLLGQVASIEPLYPWGGSSLCLWTWPYFVGLVHRHPYRTSLIIFDADELRVVAISKPVSVPELTEAVQWRGRDVLYPYHSTRESSVLNLY